MSSQTVRQISVYTIVSYMVVAFVIGLVYVVHASTRPERSEPQPIVYRSVPEDVVTLPQQNHKDIENLQKTVDELRDQVRDLEKENFKMQGALGILGFIIVTVPAIVLLYNRNKQPSPVREKEGVNV